MTEELRQTIITTATVLANKAGALARAAEAIKAARGVVVSAELLAVVRAYSDLHDLLQRAEDERDRGEDEQC